MDRLESLKHDYEGIVEVFNKEYGDKDKIIENNSAKILQQHIIYLISRLDRTKGNWWFRFKTKRKLQSMFLKIEQANKWEFY